mmetsp:Transcript_8930/g.20873  ORF Transcript_8930/g.20873 Transcript_8930/m.20873 type:complete len:526 (-) Transcript_8930:1959-3536(-)
MSLLARHKAYHQRPRIAPRPPSSVLAGLDPPYLHHPLSEHPAAAGCRPHQPEVDLQLQRPLALAQIGEQPMPFVAGFALRQYRDHPAARPRWVLVHLLRPRRLADPSRHWPACLCWWTQTLGLVGTCSHQHWGPQPLLTPEHWDRNCPPAAPLGHPPFGQSLLPRMHQPDRVLALLRLRCPLHMLQEVLLPFFPPGLAPDHHPPLLQHPRLPTRQAPAHHCHHLLLPRLGSQSSSPCPQHARLHLPPHQLAASEAACAHRTDSPAPRGCNQVEVPLALHPSLHLVHLGVHHGGQIPLPDLCPSSCPFPLPSPCCRLPLLLLHHVLQYFLQFFLVPCSSLSHLDHLRHRLDPLRHSIVFHQVCHPGLNRHLPSACHALCLARSPLSSSVLGPLAVAEPLRPHRSQLLEPCPPHQPPALEVAPAGFCPSHSASLPTACRPLFPQLHHGRRHLRPCQCLEPNQSCRPAHLHHPLLLQCLFPALSPGASKRASSSSMLHLPSQDEPPKHSTSPLAQCRQSASRMVRSRS